MQGWEIYNFNNIDLFWIYHTNTWGRNSILRVSVRPSGAGLGQVLRLHMLGVMFQGLSTSITLKVKSTVSGDNCKWSQLLSAYSCQPQKL